MKNKGITLIALVITIIVMLILAGVSISLAINGDLFKMASKANIETKIAQLGEQIHAIEANWYIDKIMNPKEVTIDDFWDRLIDNDIIGSKEDIEGPEKEGENDIYILDTTEGFIVEIIVTPDGNITIGEIVKENAAPPKIQKIEVTNKTSNKIEVQVTVIRLEKGKLNYYYKKGNEENYHELEGKQNTTDLTAEFTKLEQNQEYNIKIVAKNKKGTNEKIITVLTRELETGEITQKGETNWNNQQASIEIETSNTNLILKYQINGIDGQWEEYKGPIGELEHDDAVHAVLTDGTNYGTAATIVIKDDIPPRVTVTQGTVTTNSISVTASGVDDQWGMPVSPSYSYYIKKTTDSEYPAAKYTGANTSYTFTELTHNTEYDIKVTTADKAKNPGTGTIIIKTETVGGTGDNLSKGNIIATSPTWNKSTHKASITLSTTTNFQIQWQKNGTTGSWTTIASGTKSVTIPNLDHEDKIYARLWDGTNGGSAAYAEIRDSGAPRVTVAQGTVTTNSIAVTATGVDDQWGMPTSPSYSYYIKKATDSAYPAAKYTGTNTSYTFTGLTQNTEYDIKVTTTDKAKNPGTGTKRIKTTSAVPNFTYTGKYEIVNDNDTPYTQGNTNWKIRFLTSGILTFNNLGNAANGIDVFLVGGGGGGGGLGNSSSSWEAGGGGGGYTRTVKGVYVNTSTAYTISIGSGGSANSDGGSTSVFGYNVAGGLHGMEGPWTAEYPPPTSSGGNGGSGGGYGCWGNGSPGASNGNSAANSTSSAKGGIGQGTTTREFGESGGNLYSGGGGGSCRGSEYSGGAGGAGGGGKGSKNGENGTNGTPNTGGGGGGACRFGVDSGGIGGSGGSGIVIIRNKR